MEPQNPRETKTTIVERTRSIWEDFGPFIVGILVLLIVLGGVWYLWSKRSQLKNDTTSVVEQTTGGTVPLSTLSLSSTPTPAPTPSLKPTPTPTPKVVTVTKTEETTKGGLPKTGFAEDVLAGLFLAVSGAGFYLRRLAKKFA